MNTMLRIAIALALMLSISAQDEPKVDKRLLGTWQSDGTRTMEWIRNNRNLNAEDLTKYDALFGKMKITYTENEWTRTLNGKTDVQKYSLVATTKHQTVSITYDSLSKTDKAIIAYYDDDEKAYYVYVDEFDLREYFKKVEP